MLQIKNLHAGVEDKKILTNFSDTLSKLGFEHNLLSNNELSKRLGTSFYNVALHTKGGVLLHPGKLVRAMIDVLPSNVCLYENSSLLNWSKNKDIISCNFKNAKINTMKSVESDFQLLTYLSQSRTLTQQRLQKNTQSLEVLKSQIQTGQSKLNNLIDIHIERIGIINNLLDNTSQYEKAKYSLASMLGVFSELETFF